MTTSDHFNSIRPNLGHPAMKPFLGRLLGKPAQVQIQRMPLRIGIFATPLKTVALAWMAGLVLAINPSVTHAAFVGPTAITIDGTFTDWTGNVYSQTDGYTPNGTSGNKDITQVWSAMSTASGGTTAASSANLIQNVYFRVDTAETGSSNPTENYWFQVNLGTAPAGYADHVVQFYVDTGAAGTTADPKVKIVLYLYSTYPLIGALTTGGITAKVANYSVTGAVNDPNATGVWALNPTTSTYGFEAKIPIGWYGSTYGGSVAADGTGASLVSSAVFSTSGASIGSVGSVKDTLDYASQRTYSIQESTTTGSVSFVAEQSGGTAYSATAAATTLTPVAGANDSITLTVNKEVNGTISTDTTFTGTKSVTISGFTAAPNGSYGSFNGVTLTGSPQTISVNFVLGVATPSLILNKAASQTIGFSLPDLTYPAANNLTITPTAATVSKLVVTTEPGNGTGGSAFTTQPAVTLQDQFGNTVTGTAQDVTLAIQNNAGSGTLSGTKTVAVNTNTGVATFSGLSIDKGGNGYTLTATGSTVNITAGVVLSSGFNVMSADPVTIGRAWGTYLRIPWADVTAKIAGGTTPYTLQSVTSRDSGDYVQISGSYILFAPAGNATRILDYTVADSTSPTPLTASSTITVSVTNAVSSARTITSSGGGVTITFAGVPGYNYVVERSGDLSNWTTVQTQTAPTAGLWTFSEIPPYSPAYYRTRQNN
jgi:hypothetical protein